MYVCVCKYNSLGVCMCILCYMFYIFRNIQLKIWYVTCTPFIEKPLVLWLVHILKITYLLSAVFSGSRHEEIHFLTVHFNVISMSYSFVQAIGDVFFEYILLTRFVEKTGMHTACIERPTTPEREKTFRFIVTRNEISFTLQTLCVTKFRT